MAFVHGITTQEGTSSTTPINISAAGLPFIIGTAGGFGSTNALPVNELKLIQSWEEYVSIFGYSEPNVSCGSLKKHAYTLDEFAYAFFKLYNGEAAIFVNVLNPAIHKKSSTLVKNVIFDEKTGRAIFIDQSAILSTITLTLQEGESQAFTSADFDFVVEDGILYLQSKKTEEGTWKIPSGKNLTVSNYSVLDTSVIGAQEIIGTYDPLNGKRSGIELEKQCFQQFRQIPGIILAPHFSKIPSVAIALSSVADDESDLFTGIAIADLPSGTETIGESQIEGPVVYSEIYNYKNTNGLNYESLVLCWPSLEYDGILFNFSTHLTGVMVKTDTEHGNYTYASPSNNAAKITGMVNASGDGVWLTHREAQTINYYGVVTCLNFINSWAIFGNSCSSFPTQTAPNKYFISNVRTIRWLLNTLIINYWSRIDIPVSRIQIESLVNSANTFLDGLKTAGVLIGAEVTFNSSDNTIEDMSSGKFKIRLKWCSPPPLEHLEIVHEYDATYLSTLFG